MTDTLKMDGQVARARPILARATKTQLVGMVLWRGGLLYVSAYAGFRGFRELTRWVELPKQLEIGVAIGLTGFAFLIASVIVERVQDARAEGDLSQ